MPKKKYNVVLSEEEESYLKSITHCGNSHSAKTILHANILLMTNDAHPEKKKSYQEISNLFDISQVTINQICKTYFTLGLDAALHRKTRITYEIL